MKKAENILHCTAHRPWALPRAPWRYYQEWNSALFLHWKVPAEELAKLITGNISLDTFNGEAWISLVAFTMEKIRPRLLPAVSVISDFHEINVRTYLNHDNKPGVYFLSIEAQKQVSAVVAGSLSGLPYKKSTIGRQQETEVHRYFASNKKKGFLLDATFTVGQKITEKSALDKWLTERYCLYLDKGNAWCRYEVHHEPWDLYHVTISNLITNYTLGNISLNRKPDLAHYSPGVKVLAWPQQRLPV